MIRLATSNDILEINKLGSLIESNFSNLFDIKSILNESISKVYVYDDDGVKGFLHITCLYETIDIINIVVDPLYRRKKIASNLLDHMLGDLNSEVKTITLEVNVNNESAINLYKKFGFEIVNNRKKYYGDEDAYLMGRVI